jgi:hypothetical protein
VAKAIRTHNIRLSNIRENSNHIPIKVPIPGIKKNCLLSVCLTKIRCKPGLILIHPKYQTYNLTNWANTPPYRQKLIMRRHFVIPQKTNLLKSFTRAETTKTDGRAMTTGDRATTGGWLATTGGWLATTGGWLATITGWPAMTDGWPATTNGWLATTNGWPATTGGWPAMTKGNRATTRDCATMTGGGSAKAISFSAKDK